MNTRTLNSMRMGRWLIFLLGVGGGLTLGCGLAASTPADEAWAFILMSVALVGLSWMTVLIQNWYDREHARARRREADGSGPSAAFEASLPGEDRPSSGACSDPGCEDVSDHAPH